MTKVDLLALSPLTIVAGMSVVVMLVIAFYRNHWITVAFTLIGLLSAAASLPIVALLTPRSITPLLIIDAYSLFYMGLTFLAGITVAALSYSYLELHGGHPEEFYLLLLVATLGTAVLAASTHFASFFLGIEILSVSLYALAAYLRHSDRSIEAGVKYLILAAVSSAFILFGMALVYAEIGSMEFFKIASHAAFAGVYSLILLAGIVMIIVGIGFKLAVVPFHLWTPDVYEGAPAPVTAFIATASKGAVFTLILRFFSSVDIHAHNSLTVIFTLMAIASMFAGNLLALLQTNVKRILAYSSISHLGYLLVTLLAGGATAITAAAFYLAAYFITTLGAFGAVTVLSKRDRDADRMEDYQGLATRQPWLAGILTAMLFSLAGIPLTAGFVGKFYVVAAGVDSSLWLLIVALVVNSVIGLFYYLRIIVAIYASPAQQAEPEQIPSVLGHTVLACLTILLVWLGVYPGTVIDLIRKTIQSLI
jgi:NADH-quinone oxidoreductase subunit N